MYGSPKHFRMYFDRLDICLAHRAFACDWHSGQGSATYAKLGQLERMGFWPGAAQGTEPRDLGDNAREIYKQLVINHCGGVKSTVASEASHTRQQEA